MVQFLSGSQTFSLVGACNLMKLFGVLVCAVQDSLILYPPSLKGDPFTCCLLLMQTTTSSGHSQHRILIGSEPAVFPSRSPLKSDLKQYFGAGKSLKRTVRHVLSPLPALGRLNPFQQLMY